MMNIEADLFDLMSDSLNASTRQDHKMNRDQAKMDHLNLYISDRRYLINRIHSYQQFVRQLDNDPNSPSKRVLKYVIEN